MEGYLSIVTQGVVVVNLCNDGQRRPGLAATVLRWGIRAVMLARSTETLKLSEWDRLP